MLLLFITGAVVIHVGPHYRYAVLNRNTTLLWMSMFSLTHETHLGQKFGSPTQNYRMQQLCTICNFPCRKQEKKG